jgi:hypothetical protein
MHSHFLLLECVIMANQKITSYLNAEQRQAFLEIPINPQTEPRRAGPLIPHIPRSSLLPSILG